MKTLEELKAMLVEKKESLNKVVLIYNQLVGQIALLEKLIEEEKEK